jgi:hypothetical protein
MKEIRNGHKDLIANSGGNNHLEDLGVDGRYK